VTLVSINSVVIKFSKLALTLLQSDLDHVECHSGGLYLLYVSVEPRQ
jgi:hypothetical protein